jgi:hypothetical protein
MSGDSNSSGSAMLLAASMSPSGGAPKLRVAASSMSPAGKATGYMGGRGEGEGEEASRSDRADTLP